MFNFFQTDLNYEQFKDNKKRRYINNGAFSGAEATITWLRNLVITLFFTPVVTVTSLFAKNSIVGYANIFLALSHVTCFLYYDIFRYSYLNTILTFLGIIIASCIAISFSANFMPVTITLSSVLFSCNVVATAINSFFAMKDVIIPVIKKIIEITLSKVFGINFNTKLYVQKDFKFPTKYSQTLEDLVPLTKLTDFIPLVDRRHIPRDVLEKLFNNILHELLYYQNKYNEDIIGNIRHQDKIKEFERHITNLTSKVGDPSGAIKEFTNRYSTKQIYLDRFREVRAEIQSVYDHGNLAEFNKVAKKYLINFRPVKTQAQKEKLITDIFEKIDWNISKIEQRMEKLADAIPSYYLKKYKATENERRSPCITRFRELQSCQEQRACSSESLAASEVSTTVNDVIATANEEPPTIEAPHAAFGLC